MTIRNVEKWWFSTWDFHLLLFIILGVFIWSNSQCTHCDNSVIVYFNFQVNKCYLAKQVQKSWKLKKLSIRSKYYYHERIRNKNWTTILNLCCVTSGQNVHLHQDVKSTICIHATYSICIQCTCHSSGGLKILVLVLVVVGKMCPVCGNIKMYI